MPRDTMSGDTSERRLTPLGEEERKDEVKNRKEKAEQICQMIEEEFSGNEELETKKDQLVETRLEGNSDKDLSSEDEIILDLFDIQQKSYKFVKTAERYLRIANEGHKREMDDAYVEMKKLAKRADLAEWVESKIRFLRRQKEFKKREAKLPKLARVGEVVRQSMANEAIYQRGQAEEAERQAEAARLAAEEAQRAREAEQAAETRQRAQAERERLAAAEAETARQAAAQAAATAGVDIRRRAAEVAAEFQCNETEVMRLGLERLDLPSYVEADILIEQVISGAIDITSPSGRKKFVEAWRTTCPTLPPPCVPDRNNNWSQGDYWYLTKLKERRVVSNLSGDANPVKPNFSQAEILLVDKWQETDWDARDASAKHVSSLLQELIGRDSTVNIKREEIDSVLWQGDPALRQQSAKQKKIITKLGLKPAEFELRLIRQDEYARGATAKNWGQKNLWTNYDNYFLGDGGDRYGLGGGFRVAGGPSHVNYDSRGYADDYLAVRLVLSRKQ